MAIVITADQVLPLRAGAAKDREGNVAQLDGFPTFESSDALIASVADNGDGTALVTSHAAGMAQITMRADALIGDGVVPVIATLDVEVVAGQAAVVTIDAGAPEAKP